MNNKLTQNLLFTLLLATQIAVNIVGMENYQSPSSRKSIPSKLEIYLDQLDHIENCAKNEWEPYRKEDKLPLYKKNTHKIFNEIKQWIETSVQEPIDLNSISKEGNTLLHYLVGAAESESLDNQWAAEYKTSNNQSNTQDNQPCPMFAFTQYLLEHGANPNIQNNDGKTAFWTCMQRLPQQSKYYTTSKLIPLLLAHNADPKVSSCDNDFMCILATKEYSKTIGQIIAPITIKDYMNNKDKDGRTPACCAASMLNIKFLHILANAGADFNTKDSQNKTPLDHALACKGGFMARIFSTERTDEVISFLKTRMQANNQ